MQLGFWQHLKKPIFALAPMANVTDAAFRRIIAKYGRPSVMFTEFVSVEGLLSVGRDKLMVDFMYSESERPIVAQIFGGKPQQFFEVAKLIEKLGFDGIDINMGCPDRGVEKSGGGAALIKNPKLAQEIIQATQEGAPNLPVSVKTRLGYNKNEIETWLSALLETELAAITIHLRTRKEMSSVPAHWELAEEIVEIRNKLKSKTLILGNGDVQTVSEAREKINQYGCDGVMIGRGIFGNPWLFASSEKPSPAKRGEVGQSYIPTVAEKLAVCLEHTKLFEELYGPNSSFSKGGGRRPEDLHSKNSSPPSAVLPLKKGEGRLKPFDIMKKHYKAYINGFNGAKELRAQLMSARNVKEIEQTIIAFENKKPSSIT